MTGEDSEKGEVVFLFLSGKERLLVEGKARFYKGGLLPPSFFLDNLKKALATFTQAFVVLMPLLRSFVSFFEFLEYLPIAVLQFANKKEKS